MLRAACIVPVVIALAGCATVTRGTTNQIQITSEPSGAVVSSSLNHNCTTPCTITVNRKDEFTLTFKLDGHEDQQIFVKTQIAGSGAAGFAGNVLIGGVVGMGVDAATGSTLEHSPNPVNAVMKRLAPVAPAPKARPPKAKVPPKAAPKAAPALQG